MRHEDPEYLAFVRTLPCAHCMHPEAEPHHIIGMGLGGMGTKASDIHTMPLCRPCHRAVHDKPGDWAGSQVRWMIETQEGWLDHKKVTDSDLDLPF